MQAASRFKGDSREVDTVVIDQARMEFSWKKDNPTHIALRIAATSTPKNGDEVLPSRIRRAPRNGKAFTSPHSRGEVAAIRCRYVVYCLVFLKNSRKPNWLHPTETERNCGGEAIPSGDPNYMRSITSFTSKRDLASAAAGSSAAR
jgi:hypothetical protein